MPNYLTKPTNPKSTAVERICSQCNCIFYASLSTVKFSGARFCTKDCKHLYMGSECSPIRKEKPIRICLNCSTEYAIEAWRLKDTNRGQFCTARCQRKYRTGENAPNWRGGITKENRRIRSSRVMEKWRNAVLSRDNYACVWCGSAEQLEADHIKPFALFEDLRTDVDNGRTLCRPCHITTFSKVLA